MHGVRIEAAEVEGALEGLPDVQQAVVVVVGDDLGDRQLAAVCALRPGCFIDGDEAVHDEGLDGSLQDAERCGLQFFRMICPFLVIFCVTGSV